MIRGGMRILRGGSENFQTPERGAPKICIFRTFPKGTFDIWSRRPMHPNVWVLKSGCKRTRIAWKIEKFTKILNDHYEQSQSTLWTTVTEAILYSRLGSWHTLDVHRITWGIGRMLLNLPWIRMVNNINVLEKHLQRNFQKEIKTPHG